MKSISVSTFILLIGILELEAQKACPNPLSYSFSSSEINGPQGIMESASCRYTMHYNTDFTGNKKHVSLSIYVNSEEVYNGCVGPLESGTKSFSVNFTAACGIGDFTTHYHAHTSSSACNSTSCEDGLCQDGWCSSAFLPVDIFDFGVENKDRKTIIYWRSAKRSKFKLLPLGEIQ